MRILSEETAAKLARLLSRPAGRVTTTTPPATAPRLVPQNIQWFYIESSTAIDTSITDPSLTKSYYDAHIIVYNVAEENWTTYGQIYVTSPDDSPIPQGYSFGMCVGSQTIDDDERPLFIPSESELATDGSGSGSGSGAGNCEISNSFTLRECDPITGEQTDVTIESVPGGFRICRTPVGSGG